MVSGITIRGEVRATIFRRGRVVGQWCERNLVTSSGADALVRMAIDSLEAPISAVGFGAGSVAPTLADGGLQTPLLWRPVDDITRPSAGTLRVAWSLPAGLINSGVLRELGLRGTDATLFARRVRDEDIPMDSDISLEGVWEFTIASGG